MVIVCAGLAETDAPVTGQFVRQRGDLEVLLRQFGLHLRQQRWVDVGAGKVVERIHAAKFTIATGPALPVHARDQPARWFGAHRPARIVGLWPEEMASVQAAQVHPDADAVPAHQLEARAAPVGEHVGRVVAWRAPQRLLYMQRESVNAGAHVHRRRRQPDRIGSSTGAAGDPRSRRTQ